MYFVISVVLLCMLADSCGKINCIYYQYLIENLVKVQKRSRKLIISLSNI